MVNRKKNRFPGGILSNKNHSFEFLLRIFILKTVILFAVFIEPASGGFADSRYKFDIAAGYGFPETMCLKLKYGNNFQAGFSQSFDTQGLGASAVEFYYRIGEKPRFSEQKLWYIFLGMATYIFETNYRQEYSFLIYPRAGRTFEFSKYSGINVDMGFGVPSGRNKTSSDSIAPFILTGSINLYFRF
jgi:hypothetical protein